jgi:hypothetical protein
VPLYVVPHATAPAGSCFSKLLKSKQLASPAAGLRMPCLLAACCAGASYHGDVAAVVAAGGQGCCTVFSRTMLAAQQLHVGLRLHTYDRTSHCSWRWTLPGISYPCHSLCMLTCLVVLGPSYIQASAGATRFSLACSPTPSCHQQLQLLMQHAWLYRLSVPKHSTWVLTVHVRYLPVYGLGSSMPLCSGSRRMTCGVTSE